jgi:ABC-type dipeptide/oligopeptide/nickel transport system permease component
MLALPVLLLGISLVVFVVSHLVPGDPARVLARPFALEPTRTVCARCTGSTGHCPSSTTYLVRVVQGDLGKSFRSQRPVIVELVDRLPATIELTVAALGVGCPSASHLAAVSAQK